MDRYTQMALFVMTAESGSLSKAAERMKLSNPAASRMLSALEERLGVRLIERTTRRMWVTEAGLEYQRRCTQVLSEIDEADSIAADMVHLPRGVLRIASSVSFAMLHISPLLPELSVSHPDLSIQIVVENHYPNFLEAGIDVAVRTREHEVNSGIAIRKIGQTRRVIVASPAYLARMGKPDQPQALCNHRMLVYEYASEPYLLKLSRGKIRLGVKIRPALESNEGQIICAACRAGMGIAVQPLYIVHEDIHAGRLIPLLHDWRLAPLTINLAYQSRRHLPTKIQVFAEALIKRITDLDLAESWNNLPG